MCVVAYHLRGALAIIFVTWLTCMVESTYPKVGTLKVFGKNILETKAFLFTLVQILKSEMFVSVPKPPKVCFQHQVDCVDAT